MAKAYYANKLLQKYGALTGFGEIDLWPYTNRV